MTPLSAQTSPADLNQASLNIVQLAKDQFGDRVFWWKVGFGARRTMFLQCTAMVFSPEPPAKFQTRDLNKIEFCGLLGELQEKEFPSDRLELHSVVYGHVGTVEIVR